MTTPENPAEIQADKDVEKVMELMTKLRADWGVVYPEEE